MDAAAAVDRALQRFVADRNGQPCLVGAFVDLTFLARVAKNAAVGSAAQKITDDLWNIAIILDRLELMRVLASESDTLRKRWFYYTKVDVDHFHTEYRAMLDYVAQMIAQTSTTPGQLPGSFRKLVHKLAKYEEKLPNEMVVLLRDVDWFWEMRAVRDRVVHSGAMTLVFEGPDKGILFQVYDGLIDKLINKEYLMYNEHVVWFDRYAALYLAYLLVFLEDVAVVLTRVLGFSTAEGGSRNVSPGYGVLRGWMQALRDELGKGQPKSGEP